MRLRRTRGARLARVLASRSRDGELVARWVQRFGLVGRARLVVARRAQALRALAAAVRAGEDVAVVPDGPRGPAERVQPGVVALAALTGAPVVPFGFSARPARRLHSWDRFMVPLPFARAAVVFGAAAAVSREADRETRARIDLERTLLTEVTERGRSAGGRVMYPLYTLAFATAVAGYAPVAVLRRIARGVPINLRERLGLRAHQPPAAPCGWIHAVSVGEAIAAAPLVEGLRRRGPRCRSSCRP